jgi:flagellar motor switch protein FliN
MNAIAAKIVGNGLLKGAFDVFDAMLSCSFQFEVSEPEEVSPENLGAQLAQTPVALQGKIQGDLGAVAILFTANDAARFAALIQEQEFSDVDGISEEDRAMLKEIADPALGGGMTNLMERFGHDAVQLEDVSVVDTGAENAGALIELLAPAGAMASFTFTDNGDVSGTGVALFSQRLETMVPEDQLAGDGDALATEAELSPDEMSDILSGFGGPGGGEPAGSGSGGMDVPAPENLDMVLDIGLLATARLGRVEMPIGEILNLGPGSIIEVGHLVDEPVDLLVNGKLIARGDVVVVDEKFGLRVTEIVSTRARIESLR